MEKSIEIPGFDLDRPLEISIKIQGVDRPQEKMPYFLPIDMCVRADGGASSHLLADQTRGANEQTPQDFQGVVALHLREFPTPVILDQARERAALRGKICDRFSDEDCSEPYPFVSRGTEGTDR